MAESNMPMRWPAVSTLGVVIIAVATALCPSCRSKQTTIETRDFSQNLRSIADHQRLSLDDTLTFFRFDETDTGTVMVPERVIIRTARAEQARQQTDTAAAMTFNTHMRKTYFDKTPNLPGWANETLYTLTIGVIFLIVVAHIARKS